MDGISKLITIAIPTYNRKNQLIRLLKSIESQDCTDLLSIVIFDNCSNYSVTDTIKEEFYGDFLSSIEVIRRQVNGGGDYNISSTFGYFKSTLFWLMGDDDEMLPGSIRKVIENYQKYPEIPVFKYAMQAAFKFEEDIRLSNVDDLVRCHKKGYLLGGIIFMSNNIYNVDLVKPYFSDCLYYGYCSISHVIPMMHCLVDSDYQVMLCKDYIIKYNFAEDGGWNYGKVVTSLSTLLDINWGNKHQEIDKFFRVICAYFGLGQFLIGNIQLSDKHYRNYVYTKGMHTVFKRRKNAFDLLALLCYWVERLIHIRMLSGFYVYLMKKQRSLKEGLKQKAAHSKNAARLFSFLKQHQAIMK